MGQIVVTPRDAAPGLAAGRRKHTTPLNILVYVINKKSQNHYAEQVVKMIGAETRQGGIVGGRQRRGHRNG